MGLADSFPNVPRIVKERQHERIDSGKHWVATHRVSVGTGTAVSVLIAVSEGDYHFTPVVEMSNAGNWTLSSSPVASGGSAITPQNNRLGHGDPDGVTLSHSVTVATVGTVLESHQIGTAGVGPGSSGGAGVGRDEWEPPVGGSLLIKAVALNAGTTVDVNVHFYREDS